MCFKPLDITQSVSGWLVVSHLLSEFRTALNNNQAPNIFYMKVESERHRFDLPIKIHNRARSDLKSAGIIQVNHSQEQPHRLLGRVNTDAVLAGISGHGTPLKPKKIHPCRSSPKSSRRGPTPVLHANWNYWGPGQLNRTTKSWAKSLDKSRLHRQKRAASYSLFAKLDIPFLQNWICPKLKTRSSLSPKLYIQLDITNPTTTAQEVEVAGSQPGDGRSRNVESNGTANSIATSLFLCGQLIPKQFKRPTIGP